MTIVQRKENEDKLRESCVCVWAHFTSHHMVFAANNNNEMFRPEKFNSIELQDREMISLCNSSKRYVLSVPRDLKYNKIHTHNKCECRRCASRF